MISNYQAFIEHLKRTGRLKLLPQVLRELRTAELRAKKQVLKRETASENPSLISGWRELEGGMLTDRTGKQALIDIYKNIVA